MKKHTAPPLDALLEGTKEWKVVKKYYDHKITVKELQNLIEDYPWEVDILCKNPKSSCTYDTITTRQLLKHSLEVKTLGEIGKIYKLGAASIGKYVKMIPELQTGVGATKSVLHTRVGRILGYKKCCRCDEFLHMDMFNKDAGRIDKKATQCKLCSRIEFMKFHEANPDKQREYAEAVENDPERKERKLAATRSWKAEVNYRGMRNEEYILRRPDWTNVEKLKQIAKECPEGYHVDHIIPLKGELVSGLDIPSNLQYLLGTENLKKHNKFTPCSYEDIPPGFK